MSGLLAKSMGSGPDLVLLHGWGMNAAVWGGFAETLARDFRVHLLDLPGHGHAGWRGEQGVQAWAQAALDSAPEQAAWLGWSLGGMVAQQAAALAPGRVTHLHLMASSPRFQASDDWQSAMQAQTLRDFAAALREDAHATLSRFLALQVMGSAQAQESLRELKAAIAAQPLPRDAALDAGLEILAQADLRAAMVDVPVPQDWWFGGRDALVPVRAADAVAALLPEARIHRLAKAGHAPFLSHPAAMLGTISQPEAAHV